MSQTNELQKLIQGGAQILDVRSLEEYEKGHLKNSIHIPVDQILNQINEIDKATPVITCCAHGVRSKVAHHLLSINGFEAYDGISWLHLNELGIEFA